VAEHDDRDRLKSILAAAAEMPTADRPVYLDEACAGDDTLRREVESLLSHLEGTLVAPTSDAPSDTPGSGTAPRAGGDPERIGPYTIIGRLGEGGMGVVYKATQDFPRRTVALKVIKPHMATASVLERFRFETQVLAKLTHPGIAQIYEAGTLKTEAGEQPYFAMELVRGLPLLEHVKLRGLTVRERLTLMRKIAEAVHHAHTRGVIHRDIKPGNIVVTEEGEPKILDFGVARSLASDLQKTSNFTEFGQLVGTLPYMSPEQVAGDPDALDARSDVYSLGVVFYEMLTGALPYQLERKLLQEAMRIIQQVEPSKLSSISKVYRGDIETIVSKALEKERSRRYQSASEFASDIYRYLRDEPVTARPPRAIYQIRKFAKRHRVVAAGVSVAAIGLAAGMAATVWQLGETRRARNDLAGTNSKLERAVADVTAERDTAERALAEIDHLTGALLDFEDASRRLIGATGARRVLAGSASDVLDRLEPLTDRYGWIKPRLANASARLGAVALLDEHLGAEAVDLFADAVRLHRELVAETPGDPKLRVGLAESLIGHAAASARRGATQPALAMAGEAERIARELRDEPILTARALRARADVLRLQARIDEAESAINDAIVLVQGNGLEAEDARALLLTDLGRLLDARGANSDASDVFARAIEARRGLIAAHPADAVVRQRMLTLLYDAAERLEERGLDADALPLHQERLALAQTLAAADPDDRVASEAVITSLDALGHAFAELDRSDEAIRSAEAFLVAARRDADLDPSDLGRQRRVALATEFLGDLDIQRSRADGEPEADAILARGVGRYRDALITIRWIAGLDPARGDVKHDEARLLLAIAEAQGDGDRGAAIDAYKAAAEAFAALEGMNLLDEPSRKRWAIAARSLGTLHLNSGNGPDAVAWLVRADEIVPRELAEDAGRRAAAYALVGDAASAGEFKAKALGLLESGRALARTDPARARLREKLEAIAAE
jgi:tetratricopeptide (TPR) repeat protein